MNENYIVNINESSNKPVVIFFTSNGIRCPMPHSFNDRYDYINITKTNYYRKKEYSSIFVRDVTDMWYIYGISKKYDTVDKVLCLLKEKCRGKTVITVGSSAGGYAAILFGVLLKAERILAFSPQVDVDLWLSFYENTGKYNYLPVEFKEKLPKPEKWIGLCESKAYCFFASKSRIDIAQYEVIKNKQNFRSFLIKSDDHSKTLLSENMLDVIFAKTDKLDRLYRRMPESGYSILGFLFRSANIFRAAAILQRKLKRMIKAKLQSCFKIVDK